MGERRAFWWVPVAALLCAGCAQAAGSHKTGVQKNSDSRFAPVLQFASPERQATLGAPYESALDNLLQVNTVSYRSGGKARLYNQTGLLTIVPGTFFRAGGGYDQPWTRDASVNSWSAGSLLAPTVARNTLWSVVRREAGGRLIVQQDDQWWDQVIWAVAAWNHFLVTGDRAFLAQAYEAAQDTLVRDKQKHFNADLGLFEGASFLNDGIAGYPVPPADPRESHGSFVLDYAGADKLMALSTNCLYVGAYRAAAQMALELHRPAKEAAQWTEAADLLAARVREIFWIPDEGRFGYVLSPEGKLDSSQEGAGLAFSVIFDVATAEQAKAVLRVAHVEPNGMPDVWPSFPRYSAERPGRHNVIVWPPIEGFWAEAAARTGNLPVFSREVETLARLAHRDRDKFWEIYNSQTGVPDGGWQVRRAWFAAPNQTWSATGYLRMIYAGLFGMRFQDDGLAFAPALPEGWGDVSLAGVHYRGAVLRVQLHGAGTVVRSFQVDGVERPAHLIPAGLRGEHTVDVVLGTS